MSPTAARSVQAAVAGVTALLGSLAGSASDSRAPWIVTDFNTTATELFPLPGDDQVGVRNFFTHDLAPGNLLLPRCHDGEQKLRERYSEAGAAFHKLMCTSRREIAASMFYPACEDQGTPIKYPAEAYSKVFESSMLDTISTHILNDGVVLNNLDTWALRNATICPRTYDLIMISPPVGGQRQVYTEIASQIASLGFLVITVDHPSLSGVVEMSDGSLIFNMAGEAIRYREAELIQLNNLKTIMGTLAADGISMHSTSLAQAATVNITNSCILGHGVGGRVSMLMVANGIVSCGMVLDDRMPMPGPFTEINTPGSSTPSKDQPAFAPGPDAADLGTVQPYPSDLIEQALPDSPIFGKMIALAKGTVKYAVVGILKLVCLITNQECSGDSTSSEKRSLSHDAKLSSGPPDKYYGQPPYEYEDPYHPYPGDNDDGYKYPKYPGDDDHYKYPEYPGDDDHYQYPKYPGDDDHYKYPEYPGDDDHYQYPKYPGDDDHYKYPEYPGDDDHYKYPEYPGDDDHYQYPKYPGDDDHYKYPEYPGDDDHYQYPQYPGDDGRYKHPGPKKPTPPVWPPPGVFPPGAEPPPPPPPKNNTNDTFTPSPPPHEPSLPFPHEPSHPSPHEPSPPPPHEPSRPLPHKPSHHPHHGQPKPCCHELPEHHCHGMHPCRPPHDHIEKPEQEEENWEYDWDKCGDHENHGHDNCDHHDCENDECDHHKCKEDGCEESKDHHADNDEGHEEDADNQEDEDDGEEGEKEAYEEDEEETYEEDEEETYEEDEEETYEEDEEEAYEEDEEDGTEDEADEDGDDEED